MESAYIDGHGHVALPDKRIQQDKPEYVYRPCRGYAGSVAVEGISGRIIGWMKVEDLPGGPYRDVRHWMTHKQYLPIDRHPEA